MVHQEDAGSLVPEEEVGDAHLHRRGLAPEGGVVQLSFNSEKLKIQNPACSTGQRSSGLFSIAVLKASANLKLCSCLPNLCS